MKLWAVALLLLNCAACAPRIVIPVAMSQPGDAALDCNALDNEITATAEAAVVMGQRDRELERKNVVGTILFGAPAIDLTREEQIQYRALADRTRHLIQLKKQRGC